MNAISITSSIKKTANDRCRVRVYEAGEGQPLLYLHGVTGLLENDPFIKALAEHFHVYAPVLPGYEDSEGEDKLDTMQSFALHQFDLIDSLGIERPLLVGHCLGGMIAAEMAAISANDVEQLILIDSLGLWQDENPVPDLFAALPFELPGLLFNDAQLGEKLLTEGMDFDDAEFLTDFLVGNSKRLGMAGKLLFPIPERGLSKRLYRIKAKTDIIWGEADQFVNLSYGNAFKQGIDQSRLHGVKDAGHMVIYEKTDEVVKLIAGSV